MTVPLMFYLRESPKTWLRWAFTGAIILTALSILGSQSRGAFLAVIAMAIYLWRHSKKKWAFGLRSPGRREPHRIHAIALG